MAEFGSNFKIRVDTEALKGKAGTVSGLVSRMESQLDELNRMIERTSVYWIGEGGNAKREDYAKKRVIVETMVRRLREYPEDLLQMAGIYEDAENEAVQLPQSLPTDVIV